MIAPETAPSYPAPPPGPPTRRVPRWVVLVAALGALAMAVLGVGGVWVQRRIDPPGPPGEEIVLVIPEGASTAKIGELLEAEGVIASARVWRWYMKVKGAGGFQAGRYSLATNQALGDVIDALSEGPEIRFDRITIPEGFTVEQIAARFGGIPRFDAATVQRLATSGAIRSHYQPVGVRTLEGLLFPDTYYIDQREDEAAIVRRMVQGLDDTVADLGYDRAPQRVGLTPYETIIVASLIEREARVPEDRAKISRVIHNRLARGMRLQIDATVLYALGSHKDRVLYSDLEVDSPYNTYRISGLPPTPIAVPGRAALEAALNPAAGSWLYYVVIDASGRHGFATTAAEHQANIAEAERRGVR